jgi:hypothetical protein
MLPNPNHLPSHSSKLPVIPNITLSVIFDLDPPKLGHFFLPSRKSITMPEVAVYEDNDP